MALTNEIANLITTIGGSSIISSTVTYLFARRKYRAETDSSEIDNLKKSIEVYQTIIEDLKQENRELKTEMKELKEEINKMKLDFYNNLRKQ